MRKPIDFVPEGSRLTFVRQTALYTTTVTGKKVDSKALYKCSCGVEKELSIEAVKRGNTKSCGCLHLESVKVMASKHGLRHNPIYRIWIGIKTRCYNIDTPIYKYYGAKGVIMCDEWKNSFEAFYKWCIDNGWKKGLIIDKDIKAKALNIPALLYSPELCSLVTYTENNNSKSNNNLITYNDKVLTLAQWCIELNISRSQARKLFNV